MCRQGGRWFNRTAPWKGRSGERVEFGLKFAPPLFGLGQFVTTFAITMTYVWYANRKLDPIAEEIREELEARQEASV